MKILVVGSTGNVGSELVRLLRARGEQVRALVRSGERATALEGTGAEIVTGDLAVPATLRAALEGVETAFLLSSALPDQVELQNNFIDVARASGLRHLVKSSVMLARLDSPVRFMRWHAETEKHLESSGVPFTILRPNYFYQNLLWFAGSIAAGGFTLPAQPETRISMIDARDVAAVAASVLTQPGHEGRTYDITGAEPLSYRDTAEVLSQVLGRTIGYAYVAPAEFKPAMVGHGFPEWLVDAFIELEAEYMANEESAMVNDVVRTIGGKEPVGLARFVEDQASAFQAASVPSAQATSP